MIKLLPNIVTQERVAARLIYYAGSRTYLLHPCDVEANSSDKMTRKRKKKKKITNYSTNLKALSPKNRGKPLEPGIPECIVGHV